jgi:hypothetical protein
VARPRPPAGALRAGPLVSARINDAARLRSYEFAVPYKGKQLKGQELLTQLDKWVSYGTIEPSCRDAIRTVRAATLPAQRRHPP